MAASRLYSTIELQSRIRELIKLAKEQGYLTFDDLNEALPEGITDADELDLILTRLRRLEIDIIEASEVDRYKDGKKDTEEDLEEEERSETKVDILDDPVRMYLKQMGQVPLLTREQEVEISKRIEEAEDMVLKHINRFGIVAQAHLDLASKLIEGRERFDRVILDKKIESRERYMKNLPRLCKQVEQLSASITRQFYEMSRNSLKKRPQKLRALQRMMASLQRLYPLFYLKQIPRFICKLSWPRILEQETAIAASKQSPRAGKRAVVLAFRVCERVPDAQGLDAPGFQGKNRNGGSQSSSRHLDRKKIHQSRSIVP